MTMRSFQAANMAINKIAKKNVSVKISVIIPAYNAELYLEKALESVLRQNYPPFEIIVVDDESFDKTPDIARKFKDRIIYRQINHAGAGAARNCGIRIASSDYIAFLDSDDYWFKNKLGKLSEAILKFPNIGFFCSNYAVRYPEVGNRLLIHFSNLKIGKEINFDGPLKADPFMLLIKEMFVGTASAVVVKKNILEQAGMFKTEYRNSQDWECWLKCARLTNFVVLSDVLFYKRNHGRSLSSNKIRSFYDRRRILEDTVLIDNKVYVKGKGYMGLCRRALADINYQLGGFQYEIGKKKEAFVLFFEGLKGDRSISNLIKFWWNIGKKLIRMASFETMSKKRLRGRKKQFLG